MHKNKSSVTEDIAIEIEILYASRRPDLDESLILDCLQDRWYKNDRQVKEKHVRWGGVDKEKTEGKNCNQIPTR